MSRRPNKAGGKAIKTRRPKTLRHRDAPKAARRRRSLAATKETNVARLTRELHEALEQQTATSEVLQVISSSPGELESVFQTILENATRICDARFGILWLYDGEVFRVGAWLGVPSALADFLQRRGAFPPLDGSPLHRLLQTRDLVHIADALSEPTPGAAVKYGGARSLVAVPMRKEAKLIGAFIIYSQEVRPFTGKQIELVKSFAAQAVIAIENARLLNELRQSLEQQTATAEVLRVISSSQGRLQPVFEALLANAVRLCEAKFGVLYRYDGHLFHPEALVGVPQPLVEFHQRRGAFETVPGTPLHRLWQTRDVVHTADDAAGDPPSASTEAIHVRFSPKADMTVCAAHVRFWG